MNVPNTDSGEVITFYSYKGGSGRSMALANVACLLADLEQRSTKRRVLTIDWDLEAPGLHRFFQPHLSRTEAELDDQLGLIDLFVDVARRTAEMPASLEAPSDASWLGDLDFETYIMKSTIPGLEVMKAGRVGPEYTKTITTFDWAALYARSPWIFSWFTNELTHRYRYTLIDSRTGETDTSSICTSIMPEKLVAIFTPNLQAIQGVIRQIERAVRFRRSAADERPIRILPVPSRIENARSALRDHWRFDKPMGFQPRFERLFRDLFGLTECDLTAYFAKVQIPQMPDFAFGEPIAVLEEATRDRFTLSGSYVDLQTHLLEDEEIWEAKLDPQSEIAERPRSSAKRRSSAPAAREKFLEPRIFRIFITSAPADLPISRAIARCLQNALPKGFTEVFVDRWLPLNDPTFKKQLEAKLEKTDVLLIVSTGAGNDSDASASWEAGYFDHVNENEPERRKIPFYLFEPPVAAEVQGVSLGFRRAMLGMNVEQFESQLTVDYDEPMCRLLMNWQAIVERSIQDAGFSTPRKGPEQEPIKYVRDLKLAIFHHLKGTVEAVVKPQKQITIRVKASSMEEANEALPPDAEIRPASASSAMAIFGLLDEPITWNNFLAATADNRLAESWRDTITSVVRSSFPDRVNVDNSQIITSNDEKKAYRVILTSATKYYDDYRDFAVYFVETVDRVDYGDQSTSTLLRGLQLVFRLRSLFLENSSEFSSFVILLCPVERLPGLAATLLKELNFFRQDSISARLDEPRTWATFIPWDQIVAWSNLYRPSEMKIRETIVRITAAKTSKTDLESLRAELAAELQTLESTLRPVTADLVRSMTRKLESTVEDRKS